jgi:methylmalonyl-CoA epimerase
MNTVSLYSSAGLYTMPPDSGADGNPEDLHSDTAIMNSPYPLDHVAMAVSSLEEACHLLELIAGESCSPPEELVSQGVRATFVGSVELLEPLGPDTTVGRFLDRRGPGLHHLAFRVPDLPAALDRLREAGVRLIDTEPRTGARGHQVAFLHPRSTGGVLIELVASPSPTHP